METLRPYLFGPTTARWRRAERLLRAIHANGRNGLLKPEKPLKTKGAGGGGWTRTSDMIGYILPRAWEMMRSKPVGTPWYHEADYSRLREIFQDKGKLPATYREWLKAATLSFQNLKGFGVPVEKVYVTPDEFSAWCAARGKHLNAASRMEFVNEALAAKYADQR